MSLTEGFDKKSLTKMVDIVTILISFLAILYTRNAIVGMIGLLILYLAIRNMFKEFIYPFN